MRTSSNGPAVAVRVITLLVGAAIAMSGCSTIAPSGRAAGSSTAVPSNAPVTPAPTSRTTASPAPVVADGEGWIVFQSLADQFDPVADRDGIDHDDTIFLVRPGGSGLHRLAPTDFRGSEIRPTWSPDGHRVAFLRGHLPGDVTQLWAVDVDGTGAELLYECGAGCNTIDYPDWAPDGKSIYFSRDSDVPAAGGPPETFEVWNYDLSTHQARAVISHHDGLSVGQARVSPDGRAAVLVRCTIDMPDCTLVVASLDGRHERAITTRGLVVAYPDWSTNDDIAFNTYDLRSDPQTLEPSNLYTVHVDGSGLRQLTSYGRSDTRATQPRWASDGRGLIYTQVTRSATDPFGVRNIAYLDVSGTGVSLVKGSVIGTHPELRP